MSTNSAFEAALEKFRATSPDEAAGFAAGWNSAIEAAETMVSARKEKAHGLTIAATKAMDQFGRAIEEGAYTAVLMKLAALRVPAVTGEKIGAEK